MTCEIGRGNIVPKIHGMLMPQLIDLEMLFRRVIESGRAHTHAEASVGCSWALVPTASAGCSPVSTSEPNSPTTRPFSVEGRRPYAWALDGGVTTAIIVSGGARHQLPGPCIWYREAFLFMRGDWKVRGCSCVPGTCTQSTPPSWNHTLVTFPL